MANTYNTLPHITIGITRRFSKNAVVRYWRFLSDIACKCARSVLRHNENKHVSKGCSALPPSPSIIFDSHNPLTTLANNPSSANENTCHSPGSPGPAPRCPTVLCEVMEFRATRNKVQADMCEDRYETSENAPEASQVPSLVRGVTQSSQLGAARQYAAWTGRSGCGKVAAQRFPGAGASLRAVGRLKGERLRPTRPQPFSYPRR
jgi:hypothetical protein